MTPEQIASMPILWFEGATKRVLFELVDGKRFYLVGGRDRRPLPKGVAGFSPREMVLILNAGVDEETFRKLVMMKEKGLVNSVTEFIQPEGGTPDQSGSPG